MGISDIFVHQTTLYVRDRRTLNSVIVELQGMDLNEHIVNFRPNSQYCILFITNLEYYVYSTNFNLTAKFVDIPSYINHPIPTIITQQSVCFYSLGPV